MRILWFSVTPSLFNPHSNSHNGGGWIASLEQIVRKDESVQLGVAFEFPDDGFRYDNDGVAYYPISTKQLSWFERVRGKNNVEEKLQKCHRIIEDFKPDLIQIFGSENDFGLLCETVKIPVVIHMQGCLPPCHNALFPIGMNKYDFIFQKGISLHDRFMGLRSDGSFHRRAELEIETIKSCRYFMGRTEWDRSLVELFNPAASYFHCEEALRDSFLKGDKKWRYNPSDKKVIVSVISRPWYKGCDLILKTAQLLKRFTSLDFEWRVYGIPDISLYEFKYKIKAEDVNVKVMGTASKEQLVDAICNSSCYVHPSYIDNSPNSLCEAQILGVPVLATHVGGISSLVKDGITGLLFPANAPYTLASLIKRVVSNKTLAETLGKQARVEATNRHNPEEIHKSMLKIYHIIIDEHNN